MNFGFSMIPCTLALIPLCVGVPFSGSGGVLPQCCRAGVHFGLHGLVCGLGAGGVGVDVGYAL